MAKASVSLIQPARTPERQRLADAIAERDRRAALISAKHAEVKAVQDRRSAIWLRRNDLEERIRRAESRSGEAERRDALLRGEAPKATEDVGALRVALTEVSAELSRSQSEEAELLTDIQLLDTPCLLARLKVEDAIAEVLETDPVRTALVDELLRLQPRVTMLRRAANAAFGMSDPGAGYLPSAVTASPCPWQVARDCLATDPDARLPMPEDVFAATPPRSAA